MLRHQTSRVGYSNHTMETSQNKHNVTKLDDETKQIPVFSQTKSTLCLAVQSV